MKNKEKVIVKFKDRKQRNKVIFNWKELKLKGEQLQELEFGPKLFMNDSMCFENQSIFYKCQQLKNAGDFFFFFGFSITYWMLNLLKTVPLQKSFTS